MEVIATKNKLVDWLKISQEENDDYGSYSYIKEKKKELVDWLERSRTSVKSLKFGRPKTKQETSLLVQSMRLKTPFY